MLLTKTVKVKWNTRNKKRLESKGYIYTEMYNEIEIDVMDLTDGNHTLVEVMCDCPDCKSPYLKPIIWQSYKRHIHDDGKYYCYDCAMKLYGTKNKKDVILKNSKSFKQWCIENNKQDLLDRWDYELNKCKPSEVTYSSQGLNGKGYWFKCHRGLHESEQKRLTSLIRSKDGITMDCNKCNSFAQKGIDKLGEDFLEKYWSKNNTIDPFEINWGNNKEKIYIKCQEKDYHESYEVYPNDFIKGDRCPYCSTHHGKVHPKDSLGQYIVDNYGEEFLNLIWSEKNKKSPFKYTPKAKQDIWWKCIDDIHNDYKRKVYSANNYNFRCPDCSNERTESILQEKVRVYLKSLNIGEILHEHRCTILPINPKTKRTLPFDNEIKEIKLIIEVHGNQHYEINNWHKLKAKHCNTNPEYEFYMQQVRDRYKKIYAYMNGYHYLEIPFWTDNNTEEWKTLIDDKIQEILSQQTQSA